MSKGPILVSDNWTLKELIAAGWSEQELEWEQTCEDLAIAIAQDDEAAAKTAAASALRLAREHFADGDPRLATAIANQAMCVSASRSETAKQLLDEACQTWNATHQWIEQMQAPRVARSSLFHMRMEQKHRAAYEDNWRVKWRNIAAYAKGRLGAANLQTPRDPAAAREALARWQRERPAMLNDTRKLLAAAYLLLPGVSVI